jgi:hypothetical protein
MVWLPQLQNLNLHDLVLNGANFASTSEVSKYAILKWLSYGIKNYDIEVIFIGTISLLNSIKIYQLLQKLLVRAR